MPIPQIDQRTLQLLKLHYKLLEQGVEPLAIARMGMFMACLLYTSPSPRDVEESRMPSSA